MDCLYQKEFSEYSYGSMDHLFWQMTYVDGNKKTALALNIEILTRNEW